VLVPAAVANDVAMAMAPTMMTMDNAVAMATHEAAMAVVAPMAKAKIIIVPMAETKSRADENVNARVATMARFSIARCCQCTNSERGSRCNCDNNFTDHVVPPCQTARPHATPDDTFMEHST
jgi:hypothetical protein